MDPCLPPIFVLLAAIFGWDWFAKRRRVAERRSLNEADFLAAYRTLGAPGSDEDVLEQRRWIARELRIPEVKIAPDDDLTALRQLYGRVGTSDLGLRKLMDDLDQIENDAGLTSSREVNTVAEYVEAFLRARALAEDETEE